MGNLIDFDEARREAMAGRDECALDSVSDLLEAALRARAAESAAIAEGRFASARALNKRIRLALELAIDFVEHGG